MKLILLLAICNTAQLPLTPIVLSEDTIYVKESSVELNVLTHPAGLISVTQQEGPLNVYSRNDAGKYELRKYTGKYVYTFKAEATGTVGVFFVPVGYKDKSEIGFASIEVKAGQGAIPPPTPIVDKPETVQLVVVRDVNNVSVELAQLVADTPTWQKLSDAGHTWKFYHKDDVLAPKSNLAPPYLLIYDKGKLLKSVQLPVTKSQLLELVKGVTK